VAHFFSVKQAACPTPVAPLLFRLFSRFFVKAFWILLPGRRPLKQEPLGGLVVGFEPPLGTVPSGSKHSPSTEGTRLSPWTRSSFFCVPCTPPPTAFFPPVLSLSGLPLFFHPYPARHFLGVFSPVGCTLTPKVCSRRHFQSFIEASLGREAFAGSHFYPVLTVHFQKSTFPFLAFFYTTFFPISSPLPLSFFLSPLLLFIPRLESCKRCLLVLPQLPLSKGYPPHPPPPPFSLLYYFYYFFFKRVLGLSFPAPPLSL